MDADGNFAWQSLLRSGLISLVVADRTLRVTSVAGQAVADIKAGERLCDAVPALFGLSEAVLALKDRPPGTRLTMASIAIVADQGPAERRDYVVVHDARTDRFVLSITPSHALDKHGVEFEQHVRREQQLRDQLAAQAKAIQEANAALRRTNADLVNFTRIISHDLKAPMRAIRYSAEDISETLIDAKDPTQIEALAELRQQSVRLSRMVTDLLRYSRLDDKGEAVAVVDTRALMMSIARSLSRPRGMELEIRGEWPEVVTIAVLLDVVLRNLLDNAIKHHDREQGRITVVAERQADDLAISFTDDGPGIPKDYQEAIVQPFTKVHADRDQSSGLGLSMVHKVVSDVGGRLSIGDRTDGQRGLRVVVFWPCIAVDK